MTYAPKYSNDATGRQRVAEAQYQRNAQIAQQQNQVQAQSPAEAIIRALAGHVAGNNADKAMREYGQAEADAKSQQDASYADFISSVLSPGGQSQPTAQPKPQFNAMENGTAAPAAPGPIVEALAPPNPNGAALPISNPTARNESLDLPSPQAIAAQAQSMMDGKPSPMASAPANIQQEPSVGGNAAGSIAAVLAGTRSSDPRVRQLSQGILMNQVTQQMAPHAQMLTPSDVTSMGLPTGTTAQRKPDGTIDVIREGPNTDADLSAITNIRKEVQDLPSYKNYAAAQPIFRTMVDAATRDSKAADLNLVYGLAKIFDPTSVVREGEQLLVRDTSSLPDWIIGSINSVNGNARLQGETRQKMLQEAQSRINAYRQGLDQDLEQYRGIASRYRINEQDIIPNVGEIPRLPDISNMQFGVTQPAQVPQAQPLPSGQGYRILSVE